jgi:hypothetical protein
MSHPAVHSPFQDGFAALWHEPALFAAELTWRWCFGLAAWGLVIISGVLFLDSLKISPSDEFLLSTLQPRLLRGAVQHIFRGSLNRFLWEQTVLILGLMLLWALAATAGRAATVRRLVAMFSSDEEPPNPTWEFHPIFALSLLRAMWTMIACGAVMISLVAGNIMANNQRAAAAALLLGFGIGLSWAFGSVLNWFFGLAPLFCTRNGVTAPEALVQSVDFFSRQAVRLFGLGLVFAMLRLVWAGTMFFAVFAPLRLAHHVARGWIALIMALVALLYFAGADLLYLARLGAYVALAEDDSHPAETPQAAGPAEPFPLTDVLRVVEPT